MRPPSKEAILRAARVLEGAISVIEETPNLSEELAQLRSVRAWLLGSQLPIAERRERAARSREADRQAKLKVLGPRCAECNAVLVHELCPYCQRESLAKLLEPDDHGSECRCEECAAKPLGPADFGKLVKMSEELGLPSDVFRERQRAAELTAAGGPFYIFNERDRQRAAELTAADFDDEIPFGLGPVIRKLAASQGKTITRIGAPRKKK
jgi:hypothetical protein